MRRSLLSLLGIITLWSLFYAGVKYFFWGLYADSSFTPTLESITGYILIGSMIAYIVGGQLYARMSERIMLYVALFVGICFFVVSLVLPVFSPYFFNIGMIGIGFAYSLYVIGKNTLIGREISTSKLGSSTIGAFTTIIFIISLVGGTILGAKIGETKEFFMFGIIYFIILLIGVGGVLLFSNTRREISDFQFSLSLYTGLFRRYGIFMIALGCFWQISVEASQVAINYSIEYFGKTNAASATLLAFSSLGAIIGNVVSVKLAHKRLMSFLGFAIVFILLMFGFSSILSLARYLDAYSIVQGLAFFVGLFFGGAVNLSESHFFALLGEDKEKDYASALYGFTLSLVGALTMFVSEKILHTGSYIGISIFLGALSIIALYGGMKGIGIVKNNFER